MTTITDANFVEFLRQNRRDSYSISLSELTEILGDFGNPNLLGSLTVEEIAKYTEAAYGVLKAGKPLDEVLASMFLSGFFFHYWIVGKQMEWEAKRLLEEE